MSDNIKVAIKVRPLIKREVDENLSIQWVTQENSITSTDAEMKKRGDAKFQFDHIFDMNAKSIALFDKVVKPIVDAAVNGFNGTVFAYGQTSSGKTYTMMGTSEEPGVIPLAIEYMFDAIACATGREFLLRVSYLEIYNEKVGDLLNQANTDLKVHEDSNGQIFVECKEEVTNSPESVLSIMHKGNKNRRIGETNMNDRSSRSHTIFRITIESRDADAGSDGAIQVSQLNMVDLAGSERARQTGATGERFKEGRHINLSLLTLAIVIKQLSESQDSQKFVNFRDSKLTRLLQTSLGGNALTAIICAITPAALDESHCTLSFASRAKSIKNKPQLNEVMADGVLLKRYAKQIDKLQMELDKMKQSNGSAQVEIVQEMESKIQEKERINEHLEERIRLLQTRIIHGDNRNNTESKKKCKAKRRQTWGGTRGYRISTSIYQPRTDLSPIKEMSPPKSYTNRIQSTDIDTSFQIAFADFEIELMKSEENRESEIDSDDDSFVTFRRHITFRNDVAQKSPDTCDNNIDVTPEKASSCTQTISSQQSPGTPRTELREKIRYLTEEYSQLQEYTTLEKQLYIEDHHCDLEEKLSSEKEEFQNKISDLKNKLTEVESCNIFMKNKLNEQQITLQKFQELEQQVISLKYEKNKSEQSVFEMEDKFKKAEETNNLITDKLNKQQLEIQQFQDQEKQLTFEKDEFKFLINELQHKLTEATITNESMKNNINEQQQKIDQLQHLECINSKLQEKLKETESYNNVTMENLNKLEMETQGTIESQKKYIDDSILERTRLEEIISELQEKLKNTELDNTIMKHKISKQDLQKTYDLETEIEYITSKTNDFKNIVHKLRDELNEAVYCNSRKNEIDRQELQSQRIQELETEIIKLKSEKNECKNISTESQQLVSSPSNKTSFTQELKDNYCNDDEINHLKSRINDLQNIIQDFEREKKYFRKESLRSLDNEGDCNDNDMIKITDLSISLDDDSAKLSADLILKTQELDEIKHDVQSLKQDTETLQETIYLLTTENTELANKLSVEKAHAEKLTVHFQATINELHTQNSKTMDESFILKNDIAVLNKQIETFRSEMVTMNLNEEQVILKYEDQINIVTMKNTELLSNIAEKIKELEMLKESKSLLYEHECMYKEKLTNSMNEYKHLQTENDNLSTELIDKLEEHDRLKKEFNILKSKLALESKENSNSETEQLIAENNLLKTDLMDLNINMQILTKENLKISNQLKETMGDLNNVHKFNSFNNSDSLHLSTIFNDSLTMNDAINKNIKVDDTETTISNLQKEITHLTKLNKKLSDLKLSTCIQCTHLKESNESRRELELKVKLLSHKLEDSQKKFDRESVKTNALISKINEDLNLSSCNSSFNASFLENMNVSCMEEKLGSLNNELQALKEDHHKLSDLYKEKCNEVEDLQNNSVIELIQTNDINNSVKKSSSKTSLRLENILKVMNELQTDFQELKENYVSIRTDLGKFTNERESLLAEINSLKNTNEELLQKSSENELSLTTALEKTNILENELTDMTRNIQEFTIKYKTIENGKLLVETEMESLKDEKITNEQTINQLRRDLSCLQCQLDLIKEQKEELKNNKEYLHQEYEKKLESLNAMNKELSNSKATISQKFANYSKESENKLIELNEKINKYTTENDYLKQELIKLHQIENKFEEMKNEYQLKCQQDNTFADDNKKLKDVINITSKNIIKEINYLKPKANTQEYLDKSVDELFQTFLRTILAKEKEIIKTMQYQYEKEKQKLEDEKRQSVDAEKRTSLWAKELERETEKLQGDLCERETTCDKLQEEVVHLKNLLEQSNLERDTLKEKISLLETDLANLQTELEKYSKNDTMNEEAILIAQQREKQAQEVVKNKEIEFQMKMKLEKETCTIRIEELTCKNELLKTKNMELINSIEGLEANQKQFKNIIDLKTNELLKSNQIIQKMQTESEQFTEAFNDLNRELEEKKLRIEELTGLFKIKCDKLTEYKTNLETIVPENKLLKQQINERKTTIEQYKMEISSLKMNNEKEIDAIKDSLKLEELKGIELNKQIAELNNKNLALTEEIKILKDDYNTLQHKNAVLEKRIRNSTSKVQAEEQLEEIKDINRSLQSSLDGASNRVTELQATKTELMTKLVTLNGQYDTINKENQNLKETLLSYTFKCHDTNKYEIDEKYNVLLQEKNKIALELEAMKVLLNQKSEDIKNYTSKIKQLTEKNTELDREAEELAETINQRDAENVRFQDQFFSCRDEVDALKDQIKTLEEKNRNLYSQKLNEFSTKIEEVQKDESSYSTLKDKIQELQLELVSKTGKIATLELQIRSASFPYHTKYTELQESLLACNNMNNELRSEIQKLQKTILYVNTKECNICKQKMINKRDQTCQTMSNNLLRFTGTSSGIIDVEAKIIKLEKEKKLMKEVCRSRSKTIKELEKQIEDYKIVLNPRNS